MFSHYILACSWGGCPVQKPGPAEKISVEKEMQNKISFSGKTSYEFQFLNNKPEHEKLEHKWAFAD